MQLSLRALAYQLMLRDGLFRALEYEVLMT
jgi:hypothetical protein